MMYIYLWYLSYCVSIYSLSWTTLSPHILSYQHEQVAELYFQKWSAIANKTHFLDWKKCFLKMEDFIWQWNELCTPAIYGRAKLLIKYYICTIKLHYDLYPLISKVFRVVDSSFISVKYGGLPCICCISTYYGLDCVRFQMILEWLLNNRNFWWLVIS